MGTMGMGCIGRREGKVEWGDKKGSGKIGRATFADTKVQYPETYSNALHLKAAITASVGILG